MTESDAIAYLRSLGYRVTKPQPSSRSKRHRHCMEHVRVDGYREPVCILEGQDRATVIGFAVEIATIAQRAREAIACAA